MLLYKLRHTFGLREVTLNTKVHLMEERLFFLDKTDFWVKGSNSLYKELLLVLEGVYILEWYCVKTGFGLTELHCMYICISNES